MALFLPISYPCAFLISGFTDPFPSTYNQVFNIQKTNKTKHQNQPTKQTKAKEKERKKEEEAIDRDDQAFLLCFSSSPNTLEWVLTYSQGLCDLNSLITLLKVLSDFLNANFAGYCQILNCSD